MSVLVPAQAVLAYLRIPQVFLDRWSKDGSLPQVLPGYYDSDRLDVFLQTHACHLGRQSSPYSIQLGTGELQLLTAAEVQQRMGIDRPYLRFLTRHFLPHFKLPGGKSGYLRYSAAGVDSVMHDIQYRISAKDAYIAIGLATHQQVFRLVKAGKLRQVPPPERERRATYVYFPDFVKLLRERLPEWVETNQWLWDCSILDDPFVGLKQAAEMLGVAEYTITAHLEAQRARFIRGSDGKNIHVSYMWVQEQLVEEHVLGVTDVARLFECHVATVEGWHRSGLIECPIERHPHPNDAPYLLRPCWIEYVRRHCSPGYERTAKHFVEWRLGHSEPPRLLNNKQVSARIKRDPGTVRRWAEKGRLQGVRTPGGLWVFDSQNLTKTARILRRFD